MNNENCNEVCNIFTMHEYDLPYIAYVIGLHLMEYDETFDKDAVDNMWNEKVLPWAKEFHQKIDMVQNGKGWKNVRDKPWMDALNEWLEEKIEIENTHIYEVPITITITTTIPVQAHTNERIKDIINDNLDTIVNNLDENTMDWKYSDSSTIYEVNKSTVNKHNDVLTMDGWRAPSV